MELIVAVDENWGIGNKGELLCRVKNDLRNFRELTTGKTVILGSKTLATFPGGKPLKNRRNIIMSRDAARVIDGAEIASSVPDALRLVGNDEAVVIGGASTYKLFLPYCDTATVTKFCATFEADAFFEDLDASPEWELVSVSPEMTAEEGDSVPGLKYRFCVYKRVCRVKGKKRNLFAFLTRKSKS